MYIKNVTREQLMKAADHVALGLEVDAQLERNRYKVRLKLNPLDKTHYAGKSPLGGKLRKTGSVCYHGHYDFFKELFKLNPDAVIESNWHGRIVYTSDTFVEEAKKLGERMRGNMFDGYYLLRELCDCESE